MDYREKNKGYITASKLKLFLDSPLLYKAIYVDEIPLDNIKPVSALEIGSMVDKYLLTPEEFQKEYAFPIGGLKDDLIKYCNEKGIKLTGKEKVDDLKALIYGDRKVLTQAQEDIVIGIGSEVMSQPLFDWKGEYECQKELYGEYKGLKIKGTLDRFHYDEDGTVTIRDLKTTSQMYYNAYADNTQFYHELATRDPFHYKLQMAMYVRLVEQNYPEVGMIRVIIDAVGTTDPYFYQGIVLNYSELEDVWDMQVVPLLEYLSNLEQGIVQWNMPVETNRNKLSSNRYYKLGTEDCIQINWEYIGGSQEQKIDIPKPDETLEEFDWDSLI